ncbi:MAG TPA: integration host factor, actinobacterial type [Demequinaceae bacterium]
MGTAPNLTSDERAAALRKATAVRTARREFKDAVAKRAFTLAGAIEAAKADEGLTGIRVHDLLQCLPGVGPRRASARMGAAGIAASRRIRGLGQHQVDALVKLDRS